MVSPYDTANEFRQLMLDAECNGLTFDLMAQRLEISEDYAKQLWHGKRKVSAPIRAKLDALIAAKGNGPVGVDPLPSNELSRFSEPVAMSTADKFAVIDAQDGTAVLVEIIEPFNNHIAARKICALLNKERD